MSQHDGYRDMIRPVGHSNLNVIKCVTQAWASITGCHSRVGNHLLANLHPNVLSKKINPW